MKRSFNLSLIWAIHVVTDVMCSNKIRIEKELQLVQSMYFGLVQIFSLSKS